MRKGRLTRALPWITAALFGLLYLSNREVSNLALGLCFLVLGLNPDPKKT